ncbi:hypothetical protein [Burkholderia ubonensis]|uniref:hypothetical protein n=1 Tax=Burkholderia ubonensis TaxID=101571 RepID=UPI00387E1FD1
MRTRWLRSRVQRAADGSGRSFPRSRAVHRGANLRGQARPRVDAVHVAGKFVVGVGRCVQRHARHDHDDRGEQAEAAKQFFALIPRNLPIEKARAAPKFGASRDYYQRVKSAWIRSIYIQIIIKKIGWRFNRIACFEKWPVNASFI